MYKYILFLFVFSFSIANADFELEIRQISESDVKINYEDGLSFYEKRADSFKESGFLDKQNIELAIKNFEIVNTKFPKNLLIKFKLIESYYFLFHFLEIPRDEKEKYVQKALDYSNESLEIIAESINENKEFFSNSPALQVESLKNFPLLKEKFSEAYFWNSITWGIWGMTFGNFASAKNDVAGKIKNRAEVLIEFNPEYRDAAGYRLLGRMHSIAPKIPFFTYWIDRDYGLRLLRLANKFSILDPRNQLYLAEALIASGSMGQIEGRKLLSDLSKREPSKKYYIEELETINEAKAKIKD